MTVDGDFVVPLAAIIGLGAGVWFRGNGASWFRVATVVAFFAYLGLVVSLTLFPITLGAVSRPEVASLRSLIHLRLFEDLVRSETSRSQALPNILLGLPFGLLLPMLGVRSAWKVIVLGLGLGLGIEGFQFVEDVIYRAEYRTVDINDVALNWLGVAIGLAIFLIAHAASRSWFEDPRGGAPERL